MCKLYKGQFRDNIWKSFWEITRLPGLFLYKIPPHQPDILLIAVVHFPVDIELRVGANDVAKLLFAVCCGLVDGCGNLFGGGPLQMFVRRQVPRF